MLVPLLSFLVSKKNFSHLHFLQGQSDIANAEEWNASKNDSEDKYNICVFRMTKMSLNEHVQLNEEFTEYVRRAGYNPQSARHWKPTEVPPMDVPEVANDEPSECARDSDHRSGVQLGAAAALTIYGH